MGRTARPNQPRPFYAAAFLALFRLPDRGADGPAGIGVFPLQCEREVAKDVVIVRGAVSRPFPVHARETRVRVGVAVHRVLEMLRAFAQYFTPTAVKPTPISSCRENAPPAESPCTARKPSAIASREGGKRMMAVGCTLRHIEVGIYRSRLWWTERATCWRAG